MEPRKKIQTNSYHKKGGNGGQNDNIQLSKGMSYILRHGAVKDGIPIDKEGYVLVEDILHKLNNFKSYNNEDIYAVVEQNDKKRFELSPGKTRVRAVQGHTIKNLDEESLFETITDPSQIPVVVHGTDEKAWGFIKSQGQNRMARNHIHFAIGMPGNNEVISGMRGSCDVVIEIDAAKAMKDGIVFQKSKNGVILSDGVDHNGVIPPQYFKQATIRGRKNGKIFKPTQILDINTYEFALVLDFEANCSDQGKLECQEIIEFPVVPMNLKTKEIMYDKIFHHYVKPKVVPGITDFCTGLTGITQDMADNGIGLQDCLGRLDVWMTQNGFNKDNSIFVTCGFWDLKTCLANECGYKKIVVNDYLKQFVNIKLFYQSVLNKRINSMEEMLQDLGITLEGKHHSGIDDSKNIAKILLNLLNKGGVLTSGMAYFV